MPTKSSTSAARIEPKPSVSSRVAPLMPISVVAASHVAAPAMSALAHP